MNAATIARIAAWNVIADQDAPAGTKVIVEDGHVAVHIRGGCVARTSYGPESTLESIYEAIKDAVLASPQDPQRLPRSARKEH